MENLVLNIMTVPIFLLDIAVKWFLRRKENCEESPLGFTSNHPEKRISVVRNTVTGKWYQCVCRYWIWCVILGDDPFPAWIWVMMFSWENFCSFFCLLKLECKCCDILLISNLLFGSKCFWFCSKWMKTTINVFADYEFAFKTVLRGCPDIGTPTDNPFVLIFSVLFKLMIGG